MKFFNSLFASKTFRFLFLAFIVASTGLFVGKLVAGEWIDLVKWLCGMATARGFKPENIAAKVEKKKDEISQVVAARSDAELAGDVVDRTDK